MGIILTSTGLPLLTSTRAIASRTRAPELAPVPVPKPEPEPELQPQPQPQPGSVALQGPSRTIAYRGVTFTFSAPVSWYQSANGDPVVVTDAANLPAGTAVTAIAPASAVVGGYQAHGAMLNPVPKATNDSQGFDAGMQLTPPAGSSAVYGYSAALNVDPAVRGPFPVPVGFKGTIVKSVRAAGASPADTKMIERYVPLTFMDAPPPGAGRWFRPAASLSGAAMAWEHRVEDIAWGALRDLTAPAGLGGAGTYLAEISSQNLHHIPIWATTWDPGRRFQIVAETPSNGYPRDYGRRRGEYACCLHVYPGADQTARRDLAVILTQWGIDLDGAHRMGERHSTGAGQWYGYIEFHYIAAFLLGDTGMLARAQAHRSNSIGQCFWVSGREIGFPVDWDWGSTAGSAKYAGETYQKTELGIPEWTHTGWQQWQEETPDGLTGYIPKANANLYGHYRDTFFTTQIYELIAIGLLRNGFGLGMTGDAAIRNGPYATGNIRAAAIAYMDRSVTFDPWEVNGVSGHTPASVALYNAWRDTIPQPRWTGRPDITQSPDHREFRAGRNSGEIDFDLASRNYATERVTDREVAVSQDDCQFIDDGQIAGADPGSATRGILTGLRPGTTYCRWRQRSASGWSRWSPTWPLALAAGTASQLYKAPRNGVTVPGTASGALTNRVAPVILHKPYDAHEMPYYEPVTDAAEVVTFHAGIGYWDGGSGALSATYQWQRDAGGGFANIPGATAKSYARTPADSGASIRCIVTVNGRAASSNAVAIPASASYPAGTLIDTAFGGSAPFDWPGFWANMIAASSSGSAMRHLGSAQLAPEVARGAVHFQKTSGYPGILRQVLAASAAAGTYSWEAEFGVGFFPATTADSMVASAFFKIITGGAGDVVRGDAQMAIAPAQAPAFVSGRGSFTINPGDADKAIRLMAYVHTGVGGAGGALGGPLLSKLKIVKVA